MTIPNGPSFGQSIFKKSQSQTNLYDLQISLLSPPTMARKLLHDALHLR